MQTKLFSPCLASFIIKSSSESLSFNLAHKTCQDCGQLRPFTVKRTLGATNRVKTDTIEFFFQENPSMRLASRSIWRFWRHAFSEKSKRKKKFCQIIEVTFFALWFHDFFQNRRMQNSLQIFSVKSSWEVHWIVMFQTDVVWIST